MKEPVRRKPVERKPMKPGMAYQPGTTDKKPGMVYMDNTNLNANLADYKAALAKRKK